MVRSPLNRPSSPRSPRRLAGDAGALALAALLATTAGCATLAGGRGWGQDTTVAPGWQRLGSSAARAATDPRTWVPATAAALLQIGDADLRMADWASDHTPIFGSTVAASRASDHLRRAAIWAYLLSALATPSGKDADDWVVNKVKGMAVGAAAGGLAIGSVRLLKTQTHRKRPDGSNDLSFPSGHASDASVFATLAARNTRVLPASPALRTGLGIAYAATAVGCAWARVEGRHHFPSDVLAGLSLGHFLGALLNDAFLGLPRSEEGMVGMAVGREGVAIWVNLEPVIIGTAP